MPAEPLPTRVLLVGLMGSGKSAVGRSLAERTGWPYWDNDEKLLAAEGLDPDELLIQRGEPALRAAESRVLSALLAEPAPVVGGVAAGVVESDTDRARLRSPEAFVVYLFAPVDVLVERVGEGTDRPFLEPDPESALRRFFHRRDPLYREAANLVVDTTRGNASAQADQVLDALGGG